jgi:hypothetical protein
VWERVRHTQQLPALHAPRRACALSAPCSARARAALRRRCDAALRQRQRRHTHAARAAPCRPRTPRAARTPALQQAACLPAHGAGATSDGQARVVMMT